MRETQNPNVLANHFEDLFYCFGVRNNGKQTTVENEAGVTYSCMVRNLVGIDEKEVQEAEVSRYSIVNLMSEPSLVRTRPD